MEKIDYRFAAVVLVLDAIVCVFNSIVMAQQGHWFLLALAPLSTAYLAYIARGLWRTHP